MNEKILLKKRDFINKKLEESIHMKSLRDSKEIFIKKNLTNLQKKILSVCEFSIKEQSKILKMKPSTLYVHKYNFKKFYTIEEILSKKTSIKR